MTKYQNYVGMGKCHDVAYTNTVSMVLAETKLVLISTNRREQRYEHFLFVTHRLIVCWSLGGNERPL